MAAKGKSIETYLMDGNDTGRWCARLSLTWSGVGYKIGHEDIKKSKDIEELHNPGVYFIFGRNDDEEYDYVYVGEGEDVINRILGDHTFDKDDIYWKEAVIFTDPSPNKAHIQWLEHRFIEVVKDAGRYTLLNKDSGKKTKLSVPIEDALEDFVDNAKIIMVALTYNVFIPMPVPGSKAKVVKDFFTYTFPDSIHQARGGFYEGQFWVFKGSYFSSDGADYLSKSVKKLRAEHSSKMDSKGQLKEDVHFGSVSTALSFVTGRSINGRDAWLNGEGKSLNEIEGITTTTHKQPVKKDYEIVSDIDVDEKKRLHLMSKRIAAYAYKPEQGFLIEKGSEMSN